MTMRVKVGAAGKADVAAATIKVVAMMAAVVVIVISVRAVFVVEGVEVALPRLEVEAATILAVVVVLVVAVENSSDWSVNGIH